MGLHLLSVWAFSSCGEQGLLFLVVQELLTAGVSLVAEHPLAVGAWASAVAVRRLRSCSVWALGRVGFTRCGAQAQ